MNLISNISFPATLLLIQVCYAFQMHLPHTLITRLVQLHLFDRTTRRATLLEQFDALHILQCALYHLDWSRTNEEVM